MERIRNTRESEQTVCWNVNYSTFVWLTKSCYIVKRLKLKALHRFTSTATAVEDVTAIQNGKLGKGLKQFLTDEVLGKGKGKESLLVVDPHLCES